MNGFKYCYLILGGCTDLAGTISKVFTHWFSGKQKVPLCYSYSFLGQKRTHHYRFLFKRYMSKQWFVLPITKAKFT